MQFIRFSIFFLFLTVVSNGQVISKDTTKMGYVLGILTKRLMTPFNWKKLLFQKKELDPDAKKRVSDFAKQSL